MASINFLNIMKILLRDVNSKVGSDYIFKPTIGNENYAKVMLWARLVYFATFKNLTVKGTMFSHNNVHKYILTYPDGKTHSQIDYFLLYNRRHSSVLVIRSFSAGDCDID
jgi:hypothetical protein